MAYIFFAKSCILDVWESPEYATDSVLLTSDHASTLEPQWLKKRLLDRLKDQIVVTTINGAADVVTFLETASRILHNFKEDNVSRNTLLLLTFSRIILIFLSVLKSYPYFPYVDRIAGSLHIRTNTDQRKPVFWHISRSV